MSYIHKGSRVTNREENHQPLIPTPISINITELPGDSCYSIEKAYVWCDYVDRSPLQDAANFTITGPNNKSNKVAGTQIGLGPIFGYNPAARSMYFRGDVTPYITGNGKYKLDVDVEDWELSGISLLIIYKDFRQNFEGHLSINDGLIYTTSSAITPRQTQTVNPCEKPSFGEVLLLASGIQIYRYNDGTISCDSIQIDINDKKNYVYRDFWNANSISYDYDAGNQDVLVVLHTEKKPPQQFYNDEIAWLMMGTYYKTLACKTCPARLPTSISPRDTTICESETMQLRAQIDTTTASKNRVYTWESDPPGFFSNDQNPYIAPDKTTKYRVIANTGNGCRIGYDTVTVNVLEKPKVDAGEDVEICFGKSVTLNGTATGGFPPYTYKWTPSAGLNADNVPNPVATPDNPTHYTFTVTDKHNCSRSSQMNVKFGQQLKPVISTSTSPRICSCDSIVFDGGTGYIKYLWSTGETTQKITTNKAGRYWFWAEDMNGCKGWSDTLNLEVVEPKSSVGMIANISAAPGERIDIPVNLISSNDLDYCSLFDYTMHITFNKSLLAPTDDTPKGVVDGDNRVIEIKGNRSSNILATLHFFATLGDAVQTPLKIEMFNWNRCPEAMITASNAVFSLDGLCNEGGVRLFKANKKAIKLEPPHPDPSDKISTFTISLIEKQHVSIVITDILGRSVQTIVDSELEPGSYDYSIDVTTMPEGAYIFSLKGNVTALNRLIQVIK